MRPLTPRPAHHSRVAVRLALGLWALGMPALAATAAHADSVSTPDGTATATVADTVTTGTAIHLDGIGWKHPSNGTGSTIAIKLQEALKTEPLTGPVTNPYNGQSADEFDVWTVFEAASDGTFSADVTFPTTTNSKPALPSEWAVGTTHQLRLLSGTLEAGDRPRSVLLTFTVGAAPTLPTPQATPIPTPAPTPQPTPSASAAAIAKATEQVRTDEAALASIQKQIAAAKSERKTAKSKLAKAQKAATTGTTAQRAAARKKAATQLKAIKKLTAQLETLEKAKVKAQTQLATSQSALAALR